jgi:phospholipid/cholesterol/gamma-HCH transport system substrate-binding protein
MEIRARFVLIGLFVLAVIAAGFGFVYWMENTGGLGERTAYRIRFEQSVSGLLLGSAVQFNGIRVGEVTDLKLDREDPRAVIVTIAVASDTPVRTNTEVGLVFGGLTGVPEIALSGGSPTAPPPESSDSEPPLLVASTRSANWTDAAREAFARIDTLLSDNSDALKDTIANLDTFSQALAKNSGNLDAIVEGLVRLTGGSAKPPANAINLSAATGFPPLASAPAGQLIVARPTAPVSLETPRILVEAPDGRIAPGFDDAQWADTATLLIQAKLVESFENAGYLHVASDTAGLLADHQLLIELRAFQIKGGEQPTATVDFTAKLADAGGNMISAKRFQASAPVDAMEATAAATALGEAFHKAATDLVGWTLPLI